MAAPVRKVRLRDIAEATGFSINTVSHALKGLPDISAATRAVIRAKAREMGYIADSVAGSLRSGRTRTVAVILGDMANPHFGLWVRAIETEAFAAGYSTLVMNTDEDEAVERAAIRTAAGKRVDGLILCPAQQTRDNLALVRQTGIPYVLVGRRFEDDSSPYVVPDDVRSGFLATRHLLERRCRSILMLNGPAWISSARERQLGYCRALAEAGLPCAPNLIRHSGVKSGQARAALEQVLSEQLPFDGILAFSDLMALEAMACLRQHGRDYQALPLAGFDDILSGLDLPVDLSSVRAHESVATRAFHNLAAQMEHNPGSPVQTVLDVVLIEHRSKA